MKNYFLTNKRAFLLIGAFFIIGSLFRIINVYPVSCWSDSLKNVLQVGQILRDNYTPIFFSGQAWMGISGSYVFALYMKVFGCNDLSIAFFGYLNSLLWYVLAIFLCFRFFGLRAAILLAFMWMIPSPTVMRWVPTMRPDYQVAFLVVPVLLVTARWVIVRYKAQKNIAAPLFCLGVITGFAFWTNMGTGPAGMSAIAVVFLYTFKKFIKKIYFYVLGGIIGFFPVIYYNITTDLIFFKQASTFDNLHRLGSVFKAFFNNAFPYFFGISFQLSHSLMYKIMAYTFLGWVVVVYIWGGLKLLKGFKEKKDVSSLALLFVYLCLHMFIASASNFGDRYSHIYYPTAYLTVLHGVIYAVPAMVVDTCKNKYIRALLFLPILFFALNNVYVNKEYCERFYNAIKNNGLSKGNSYPIRESEFFKMSKEHDFKYGYGIGAEADLANLYTFGEVFTADFYQERYLPYALKADSSFNLFWSNPPFASLKQIDCSYSTKNTGGKVVAYGFSKDIYYKKRQEPMSVTVSDNKLQQNFLTDKNMSTYWSLSSYDVKTGSIEIIFPQAILLSEIVFFPTKHYTFGHNFKVEASVDGKRWETVYSDNRISAFFFSVFHPFLKIVKPRAEIVLKHRKRAKYYRIVFDKRGTRDDVSFNEIYFYTHLKKESDSQYRESISEVIDFVAKKNKSNVVVADHFFESFFKSNGFETEFLSNRFVTSTGIENPHLEKIQPIYFDKPKTVILSSGDIIKAKNMLSLYDIKYTEKKFGIFSVLDTEPTKNNAMLYFTGLDFIDLAGRGGKNDLKYPNLKNIFKLVKHQNYNFGDAFLVTDHVINDLSKTQTEIFFEVESLGGKQIPAYLFVHLYDIEGKLVTQGDVEISDMSGSFVNWEKGQKHIIRSMLTMPDKLQGSFLVKIGIWYPQEGKRLKEKTKDTDIVEIAKINRYI